MNLADLARNAAISLEAKKDALQQRQSGDWKISFTVQGVDMNPRLTQAAMGTRYAMVLVEIGDDELPVPQAKEASARPGQTTAPSSDRVKRDWREIPPAQQSALRCGDPIFRAFLKEQRSDDWHEAPDAAQCVRLICGVESRAELSTNQRARVIWHQLDGQFDAWKALEHA